MRTKQDYINGLSKMKRNIYFDGQLIDRTDELQMRCLNTIGTTYDEAARPENRELMTAISHLTGERINRFNHIHQNSDDLHKKQDMTRMLCQKVGGCIQRCMGTDAVNAIYNVSYEADKANNGATQYHENFKKWLIRFQKEDLIGCCAQTDVKGDRMLRPADQPNPDVYVHIKEKLKDGIVVEGCKVHISEASVADEVLVLPTRALRPQDKDYAVAFAVPGDWDGLKQVVTIHNLREREYFPRGFMPGSTDSYMIFENCFVPWERVFLAGEHQHGGVNALLFALFHRHSYSGCKPAIGDVILGSAALAAECNNIQKAEHVRKKLAEIIMVTELGYAAGYTASDLGGPQVFMPGKGFVPYGPGSYIPHSIYCNVGRCLSGEAVWRESEILCDLAGGIVATFPHEKDFVNPETKDALLKYTKRSPNISVEDQAQFWRFLGDALCSATGGIRNIGAYHGGGSPIMEQIAITTQYDIEARKKLVKYIAGMSGGDREALAKSNFIKRPKKDK
ncbi:MAG TPA: 4-hydroxyphenylacetate 3-hydroxylase N-terminal domain-containing protein [Smithellaceae bacterium]|nr:4-hydroxyphenylacetate 3-hydroxylase N-terminal domain-containing protein [Smithellaceae bacterium]HOM69793.1 4-hydroxyphenylacetate 3-hydroxylase N-terminal domain-containing protein [Smithellaceae bacterium]HOS09564.1 4-hydroxyphenylacetate 3-hydroxylase N-terminal domain-containing protein [Smithellaceae bacterium]HOU04891.1 4-hydroxyphenylacetate 3-hydroxylase N-terminal domain-containing protein [Smithellaceae bacterium]HPD50009.1 4-hydroxyphenylacetate 3-hydroxylase N-terminal domain-c